MSDVVNTHFEKIQSFPCDYAVAHFTQYESSRTGLRVAVVDRRSTKVLGDFCLATEIHDDSGAPHTLEHLIFMGSRSHQYKGILDKLANRAYSSTNAWTDTDHTNYTLETAGWAGFAQILPIYLEHIILPTLHDSACYTEVHHVDGDGNDAGVVYSEMQALQNSAGEIMDLETKKLMFPEQIGYRYETGGMMEPLRVLTNERIRDFHKLMYQPKNLRLCITGQVDHKELLTILDKFEDGILNHIPAMSTPFKRPWIESPQPPAIEEDILKRVEFPEEDESVGEVYTCMFGPKVNSSIEVRALNVMTDYLSGSSASILKNIIVEREQLASSVDVFPQIRTTLVIWILLSSVETSKLEEAEKRLWQVLETVASEPLDMSYLRDCASRIRKQIVYDTETDLGSFTTDLITDHLYGHRDGTDLEDDLSSLKGYEEIEAWSEQRWKDFLNKYFVRNKHISVLGVPCAKLSEQLKADERARIEQRRKELGSEGLEKLSKALEQAKKDNEPTIPDHIFQALPVPSSDTIPWMETITAQSGRVRPIPRPINDIQKLVDADADDLPLFIHFEHMPAKCVYMSILLFTDPIPVELKPLLGIYMANFFTAPVVRDGKRSEFEGVIKDLERSTVSYAIECGSGSHTECIRIRLVVEPEKYAAGVQWFHDLIFNSVFEVERLQTAIGKQLADIPSQKREGSTMSGAIDRMIHMDIKSAKRSQSTLVQAVYLKRLKRLLKSNPDDVIANFERLRKCLFTFENMRGLVSADVANLHNPVSAWKPLIAKLDTSKPLLPINPQLDYYSEKAKAPGSIAYIVPMPTVDSSFGYFTTKALGGHAHPRLPALLLALNYLDAADGPLWIAVRGSGLAYGTNFIYSQQTGLLKLSIYRSPDAYKAFEAARAVVSSFAQGDLPIDSFTLEGAVSNLVLSFANEQTTIVSAGLLGFINPVILGIPRDYGKQLLRDVRNVTAYDVVLAMKELVMPIFQYNTTNMIITCAPSMTESLEVNFKKAGFEPETKSLDFFQDDYGLGASEEDDEDDEDDDDEDGHGDEEGEDDDEEMDDEVASDASDTDVDMTTKKRSS